MKTRLWTRQARRASASEGRRRQAREWDAFEDVTDELVARHRMLGGTGKGLPDQVFQNNKFIVQVHFGANVLGIPAKKAMIRRSDAEPVVGWRDLQRVKNEVFGEDAEAIQVFPRQSDVVDVANIYWLWVVEAPRPRPVPACEGGAT